MQKYDVFISYRRDGGDVTAKYLRDALTERGYKVFLDVESLRNGPFNEALYEVIENTKDFLLVLPPNGLDRCVNENDWVRLEIEHAKECDRNIVPIMLKGFSFPEELPESIDFIRFQSAPPNMEINFFDAYVDKLQTFLISKPRSLKKRILLFALILLLLCASGFGLYTYRSTYPLTAKDKDLVSALISYTTLNLDRIDLAGDRYKKELDRALLAATGKASDSVIKVRFELFEYSKKIYEQAETIADPPDSLRQQLTKSPFNVENLDSLNSYIVSIMTEYANTLEFICDELIGNEDYRTEDITEYIKILKETADLDAEMVIYQLNECLLPITNDDALIILKQDILPGMTFLYSGRHELTHDESLLYQHEEALYQMYSKLVSRYEENIQWDLNNVDPDQILNQLEMINMFKEHTGADTSELEETLLGILEKAEESGTAQSDVMDMDKDPEEIKQEIYREFKPLVSDDLPTLWGKGQMFLMINMPSAAAECFSLYITNGDEESKVYGEAALRFAETFTEHGLEGGVVVCFYEEDLPQQAVKIGDVIYEVNGEPVRTYNEFADAISEEGIYPIKIVHFTETGYDYSESVFDTSLGGIAILGLTDDDITEDE